MTLRQGSRETDFNGCNSPWGTHPPTSVGLNIFWTPALNKAEQLTHISKQTNH